MPDFDSIAVRLFRFAMKRFVILVCVLNLSLFGVCPESIKSNKALISEQLIGLRAESVDSSEPQRYPAKALAKSSARIEPLQKNTQHIVGN
ncbi:MAG: hypothetical protein HRU48_22640 [Vibrio sp.]|uniref:hypothetical protein n=1 Tax=Vibrio sp. TaxID=678 RepID=UPI001EC66FBA|nr:hypothetical protein [Vibrio sp.]NRB70110.1 hypothetical protein [Vibrio sp.]